MQCEVFSFFVCAFVFTLVYVLLIDMDLVTRDSAGEAAGLLDNKNVVQHGAMTGKRVAILSFIYGKTIEKLEMIG